MIFSLGQKIIIDGINSFRGTKLEGIVVGKIKNVNAYIIATTIPGETNAILFRRFGLPIRNIELDFGKFSGSNKEYVISGKLLTEKIEGL